MNATVWPVGCVFSMQRVLDGMFQREDRVKLVD